MYDTYRQHARSGDYVPENSGEDVKNGNVDKIRRRQKNQKVHFFFRFSKNKKTWSPPKLNFGGLHVFRFFKI